MLNVNGFSFPIKDKNYQNTFFLKPSYTYSQEKYLKYKDKEKLKVKEKKKDITGKC